jgi:hypothetical protein
MKRPPIARCIATVVGCGILSLAGCKKKDAEITPVPATQDAATPAPAPAAKAAPAPAALVSAESNSFDAVAARLDRGGSLYLYLSTEQWLSALSGQLTNWRELARNAAGDKQDAATLEQITRAFDTAASLVKKSGLESITGFGASSFALERGVYRNKFFVHHYPGKGDGFMWSMLGKAPHPLTALDLLPSDTALAAFMDLDLAQLIGTLREEVEQSGIPEARQGLDQGLLQFSAMVGMTLDELLQSLGGGIGFVVTLDPSKPIAVPIGEKTESIPTPRMALLFQVKNDRIFQQIDKAFATNPTIIRVDEPNLRMRTMVMPVLPAMPVRATVAQWGEYLVLTSDDQLVRDFIAVQGNGHGFKGTPEFVNLAKGLPELGNGFQISTQRFADTWNRYQGEIMKSQPGMTPDQMAMMQKLWGDKKAGASYSVTGHVENGWLAVGKGTMGAGQIIAPLIIVPAAIAAGVAMPVFGKVQEKGKATKSLSNAKQIATACKLYAIDNNGKFPPKLQALVPDYLPDATVFVSPFEPGEEVGYEYVTGLSDSSPPATDLVEDKFSARGGSRVVVRVDGSGEVIPIKK